MRPPRGATVRHEITRVRGRARNLERRFIAPDLTELSPTYAEMTRSGAAGAFAVTSHFLNETTTAIQHDGHSEQGNIRTDLVSTPSRFLIDEEGLYLVDEDIAWLDTAGGYGITLGYGVNSPSGIRGTLPSTPTNVGDVTLFSVARLVFLNEGDYVTQLVGQDSGITKTFGHLPTIRVARIVGANAVSGALADIDGGGA